MQEKQCTEFGIEYSYQPVIGVCDCCNTPIAGNVKVVGSYACCEPCFDKINGAYCAICGTREIKLLKKVDVNDRGEYICGGCENRYKMKTCFRCGVKTYGGDTMTYNRKVVKDTVGNEIDSNKCDGDYDCDECEIEFLEEKHLITDGKTIIIKCEEVKEEICEKCFDRYY